MNILLFTTELSIVACRHMVPYYYKGESMKIPDIAEVYGFKPRSINPSFSVLVRAGILSSRVGGRYEDRGFLFAKDPKTISVYDIVSALEGEEEVDCCGNLLSCYPAGCNGCKIYKKLQKLIDNRKKALSATTIYKLYKEIKNI